MTNEHYPASRPAWLESSSCSAPIPTETHQTVITHFTREGGHVINSTHWSNHETILLIRAWGEHRDEFAEIKRNHSVWNKVLDKLLSLGFYRTIEQCRNRWKFLESKYKAAKREFRETQQHPIWEFFDEMDMAKGVATVASLSGEPSAYCRSQSPLTTHARAQRYATTPPSHYPPASTIPFPTMQGSASNNLQDTRIPTPLPSSQTHAVAMPPNTLPPPSQPSAYPTPALPPSSLAQNSQHHHSHLLNPAAPTKFQSLLQLPPLRSSFANYADHVDTTPPRRTVFSRARSLSDNHSQRDASGDDAPYCTQPRQRLMSSARQAVCGNGEGGKRPPQDPDDLPRKHFRSESLYKSNLSGGDNDDIHNSIKDTVSMLWSAPLNDSSKVTKSALLSFLTHLSRSREEREARRARERREMEQTRLLEEERYHEFQMQLVSLVSRHLEPDLLDGDAVASTANSSVSATAPTPTNMSPATMQAPGADNNGNTSWEPIVTIGRISPALSTWTPPGISMPAGNDDTPAMESISTKAAQLTSSASYDQSSTPRLLTALKYEGTANYPSATMRLKETVKYCPATKPSNRVDQISAINGTDEVKRPDGISKHTETNRDHTQSPPRKA